MKRIKFTNVLDVIVVDDPDQIRALANNDNIDRQFEPHPAVNSVILKRTLNTLSYSGG